jgi:hypothetical protein
VCRHGFAGSNGDDGDNDDDSLHHDELRVISIPMCMPSVPQQWSARPTTHLGSVPCQTQEVEYVTDLLTPKVFDAHTGTGAIAIAIAISLTLRARRDQIKIKLR